MKQLGAIIPFAFAAAATIAIAACSISELPGPKYVPESTALVSPEPQIPDIWIGCWRGTVDSFDTVTSLSPSIQASQIKALSTTYEFCFKKRPDGTGEMQLADLEIGGHKATVTHFDNRFITVGSIPDRASLRNHATYENVMYALLIIPVHITQDIYAEEDIQIVTPNSVVVKGKQLAVMGGNMIATMTFHTTFNRVTSAVRNS